MVREPDSEADIWWATRENGSPNFEMDERTFLLNRERAVDYLNMLDRLYVFDGYAGWDPAVRSAFRVAIGCEVRGRLNVGLALSFRGEKV